MEMFGVFTCVTFLTFLFGKGEALKCYQCTKTTASGNYAGDTVVEAMVNSMTAQNNAICDKDGEDYTGDSAKLSTSCGTAAGGYEYRCMKTKAAKMSFKYNGKDVTLEGNSRACIAVKTSDNVASDCNAIDQVKKMMSGSGMSELSATGTACLCATDDCNGSQALMASGLLIMAIMVLAKLF